MFSQLNGVFELELTQAQTLSLAACKEEAGTVKKGRSDERAMEDWMLYSSRPKVKIYSRRNRAGSVG